MIFRNLSIYRLPCFLVDVREWPKFSHGLVYHRKSASTLRPIRITIFGSASISAFEVRKFTIQERRANLPSTIALERYASPPFWSRASSSLFTRFTYSSSDEFGGRYRKV